MQHADMSDCGIVYVATGSDSYLEEAFLSAASVKQRYPGLPVLLFTDRPWHALCATDCFDTVRACGDADSKEPGLGQRCVGKLHRSWYLSQSPFTRTLHLDTDTRVLTDGLMDLFGLLDTFTIGMVETTTDDSFSRRSFGGRMFNTGVILYRNVAPVQHLFTRWHELSRRNFLMAQTGTLPRQALLAHVTDPAALRKLLLFDQIAMVELFSPDINPMGLAATTLGPEWNHRGSKMLANNLVPPKILHNPALRELLYADMLSQAFVWRSTGRARQAAGLEHYVKSLYAARANAPMAHV